MPRAYDDGGWLGPKWLVAAVVLVADGLLLHYDLRLGLAAGIVTATLLALWLYIALRYGSLSGAPSLRAGLVERSRQQEAYRREAATRASRRSGLEQRADPPQRP